MRLDDWDDLFLSVVVPVLMTLIIHFGGWL